LIMSMDIGAYQLSRCGGLVYWFAIAPDSLFMWPSPLAFYTTAACNRFRLHLLAQGPGRLSGKLALVV
jgi:hypothetical protein